MLIINALSLILNFAIPYIIDEIVGSSHHRQIDPLTWLLHGHHQSCARHSWRHIVFDLDARG
jgi:hypothetical protein